MLGKNNIFIAMKYFGSFVILTGLICVFKIEAKQVTTSSNAKSQNEEQKNG